MKDSCLSVAPYRNRGQGLVNYKMRGEIVSESKFQDFVANIAERRHVEHLVKLWQAADNENVEQGRRMYSLALQGKARLIWARAEGPVACPACNSRNVSMPDDKDQIDCIECGIWFGPAHPSNEHCLEFAPDGKFEF